jgi:hypothetical protein
MADIKEPQPVLPVIGLIFVPDMTADVLQELRGDIGNVVLKSNPMLFTHTRYYDQEMGGGLMRQWYGFDKLVSPDVLIGLKHNTNIIEKKYLNAKGGRSINIDPGLLSLSNLVLASTKNYAHRIYLGQGIYGEVTLIYKENRFNPLEWTYPDYTEKSALEFFQRARVILKDKLSVPDIKTRK